MTVKELVEAVERCQKQRLMDTPFGDRGHFPNFSTFNLRVHEICDAFTDPSPIDRERLEAIGLEKRGDDDVWFGNFGEWFVEVCYHGDGSTEVLVDSESQHVIETIGDLQHLIWRLSRPSETKGG